MTTVIAWSTGVDARAVWSWPARLILLMQYVILFFYSPFSLFMTKADKCAKRPDTAAFSRLNWTTMLIIASAYAVIAFLCTYLAFGAMQALFESDARLADPGFEVAGVIACCWFWLAAARDCSSALIPYLIAGSCLFTTSRSATCCRFPYWAQVLRCMWFSMRSPGSKRNRSPLPVK